MFSFLRCIGRREKSGSQQRDQLDQKSCFRNAAEAPKSGSDHSDSTQGTSTFEPKKRDSYEGTPASPMSTGKKSYCSSVISRSSATFSHFRSGISSVEPAQSVNDYRLSIDLGLQSPSTRSKMLSGGLNLQIKYTEFSLDRSLTINEEGEQPPSARRHSYSDDPFAPPTPRGATFTPSFYRDSGAESVTTRDSILTARAPEIDLKETSDDFAILDSGFVQPQLPTIARISKLSFGDWILESPEESPVPLSRPRLPSTTRRSTLASSVSTYRTPMGTSIMNSPRKTYTLRSIKTRDTNQVPFPEYP